MLPKIAIIMQARTGSTRMSGKMLQPFYNGQCILALLLKRIKENCPIETIVATTTDPRDQAIEDCCSFLQVSCFRGNELDVMQRFIDAAQAYRVNKIVRICADNPFLDISSLNKLAAGLLYLDTDYWAFFTPDGTPSIRTHFGFWAEGLTLSALERIREYTAEPFHREHVTSFLYSNPSLFSIHQESIHPSIASFKDIRLTIDTDKDFRNLQQIYAETIGKEELMDIKDIIKFLEERPAFRLDMAEQIRLNSKGQ